MNADRLSTITAHLLAGWLGAVLLFAAVVAPAAFAVLPTAALAGALVGRVLPVLFVAGILLGALVVAGAAGRSGPRRRLGRVVAGGTLLLACGVAQFVIGERIERVRAAAGSSLDQLAADDPIRVTFGRLHGLSVAGLGVAAAGATAALIVLVAAPKGRRSEP